jgi:hypothetical protein
MKKLFALVILVTMLGGCVAYVPARPYYGGPYPGPYPYQPHYYGGWYR